METKMCGRCGVVKTFAEFSKSASNKSGRQSYCKKCNKELHYKNRKEKLVAMKEWYQKNRKENLEVAKKWREENREIFLALLKKWRDENPDKVRANVGKRAAALAKATPPWLSAAQRKELADFYRNCPAGHVVDHQLPVQGKDICGLNVLANLQYLTKTENLIKNNKFVPYVQIFKKPKRPKSA